MDVPRGFLKVSEDEARRLGLTSMTENEAYNQGLLIVGTWKPISESWSLRYGSHLMSLVSTVVPVALSHRLRIVHKLQMLKPNLFMTVFAPTIVTGVINFAMHTLLVTRDVILSKTACPTCLEVRSLATQMATGVALPVACTFAANFLFFRGLSLRAPGISDGHYIKWSITMMKKCRTVILANAAVQAAALAFLINFERKQWHSMTKRWEVTSPAPVS